jgi:hypothetical protein
MVYGENCTVVQYELKTNGDPLRRNILSLELRLLIAFRDYHSMTHENASIHREVEERPGFVTANPIRDCLPCVWRTTPKNCGRQATGTGILNMTLSASAAWTFRRISSIHVSSGSI